MKSFSLSKAFRHGWSVFEKRPWFFILSTLLSLVVFGAFTFFLDIELGMGFLLSTGLYMLGFFGQVFLTLLWLTIALQSTKKSFTPTWKMFLSRTGRFWHLALATLYFHIILGAITALGAISLVFGPIGIAVALFAVLLVIAAIGRYQLYFFVVMEKGTASNSLRKSASLTRGHRFRFLLFLYVLVLINTAGFLSFGVGILITIPISWLALAHVYTQLRTK